MTETAADAVTEQQDVDFSAYQQAMQDVDLQVSAGVLTDAQGVAAKQQIGTRPSRARMGLSRSAISGR